MNPKFIETLGGDLGASVPRATSEIAVYGFIAYLVARELETTRQRFEVVYWAGVLISLVDFSRMLRLWPQPVRA